MRWQQRVKKNTYPVQGIASDISDVNTA